MLSILYLLWVFSPPGCSLHHYSHCRPHSPTLSCFPDSYLLWSNFGNGWLAFRNLCLLSSSAVFSSQALSHFSTLSPTASRLTISLAVSSSFSIGEIPPPHLHAPLLDSKIPSHSAPSGPAEPQPSHIFPLSFYHLIHRLPTKRLY